MLQKWFFVNHMGKQGLLLISYMKTVNSFLTPFVCGKLVLTISCKFLKTCICSSIIKILISLRTFVLKSIYLNRIMNEGITNITPVHLCVTGVYICCQMQFVFFGFSTILMISLPFKLSGSFRFHKRGSNG